VKALERQSLIDRTSLWRFLSGRLVGLLFLLGFQVALVRLLPPAGYARYALVVALAALLQTVTSLGIPRVLAKFVSGAGETLDATAARTLSLAMLGLRLSAGLLVLVAGALAVRLLGFEGGGEAAGPLVAAGTAYALAGALQMDADALVQALRLQIASRRAAVGEPAARFLLVLGLTLAGDRDVAAVLWISAATSAGAAAMLIGPALKTLAARNAPAALGTLDWREVRRVAVGGYGGTLSWLALSPAVIRLIAARVLPLEVFAGFSFVQTLTVSAQRYAPSFTLFPLIEPAVMADAARTGRADRLGAALSLLTKLDALLVGAAIVVVSAAGTPVLLVLTHGRYGEAAVFLPWMLAGIVANASHRSYEIAAIGLGVASALTRALALTLMWLAVAIVTAPWAGVWPLLLCPLGDALTRLWFIQSALDRKGAPGLIDLRGLSLILVVAAGVSVASASAATGLHAGALGEFGAALTGVGLFAVLAFALRPISPLEAAVLPAGRWFWTRFGRWAHASPGPLRVMVLTPRGFGGTGGVDRLMDGLRPLLDARRDVSIRFIATRGRRLWTSPVTSALAMARLTLACTLKQVDLIHVNLGARLGCYRKMALIAIPRRLGTPYVLHLHGSAFEAFWLAAPRFAQRRIDRLFRDAAQVVVLGEAGRKLVARRVPEAAPRITILPNATAPIEKQWGLSDQGVQLLFLGELSARKGASVLIEALGRLRTDVPWRAVIAGDGHVAAARRSVKRFGLCGRVRLTGWVGAAEIERLLATSDILVLPSFEETLPMAVIEAFGAGLAVIATPVGAVPDILKPGETGMTVAPGDVAGLTEAIDVLIEDPVLRDRLGAAAGAYHAAHLSLAPYAELLVGLWRAAAGASTNTA
jgi:glycosyltransferase involved in cell wall biosynthesis/O-antigen/teichoic acid export membrane protein